MSNHTHDRAVSEVLGTAMLVAITVLLAAVIGYTVTNMDISNDPAPSVVLDTDRVNDSIVAIEHQGGNTLNLNKTTIRVNSTTINASGELRAGDQLLVPANESDSIQVTYEQNGRSYRLYAN